MSAALALATLAASPRPARAQSPHELRFDARVDVPLTVALYALEIGSEIGLKSRLAPRAPRWSDRDHNGHDTLNGFDAGVYTLAFRDQKAARNLSNFALATAALTTVGSSLLAAQLDGHGLAPIAENTLIAAEATGAAMVLNQVTKFIAGRARPCAHFARPHAHMPCGKDRIDDNLSFFSGHTTFTTALWVSSGTVASLRGYSLAPLVWTTGGLFALSTGYLRIAAAKHYATDVLVGALVGSAVGFAVPFLFHGRADEPTTAKPAQLTAPLASPAMLSFSGTW